MHSLFLLGMFKKITYHTIFHWIWQIYAENEVKVSLHNNLVITLSDLVNTNLATIPEI